MWGCSVQEMGGNVVIGHSIYGVVVIDGLLYSRFYGLTWYAYYPTRACVKRLSNQFCPSVSLSVCPVKNF